MSFLVSFLITVLLLSFPLLALSSFYSFAELEGERLRIGQIERDDIKEREANQSEEEKDARGKKEKKVLGVKVPLCCHFSFLARNSKLMRLDGFVARGAITVDRIRHSNLDSSHLLTSVSELPPKITLFTIITCHYLSQL